jgi:predicted regulator of Ras-like GTPase activity (Roadblock/LC7/MglB family)
MDGLAARPEVVGAAVVSLDGLVIEQVLPSETDGDALAALATAVLGHAAEIGTTCRLGPLGLAVLDYQEGPAIVARLDDRAGLVVLTRPDVDLGELLYLIRRESPALVSQL